MPQHWHVLRKVRVVGNLWVGDPAGTLTGWPWSQSSDIRS